MISSLLPAFLSAALIVGGCGMLYEGARQRRLLIAQRVSLVTAAASAPTGEKRAEAEFEESALIRVTAQGVRDADLLELARICRRVGINPRYALWTFAAIRLAAGALLALAAVLTLRIFVHQPARLELIALVLAPLAIIVGWLAPLLIVRHRVKRRVDAVSTALPDALELLVVCVEAGLALEDGLDRVTSELRRSQPELADELAQTSADLKILPDRDQAFGKLAERIGTPGVRSVVTTLSQTLRYGTPLVAGLRVAASELRNEFLLRLEERANRLPSLMTVPMMLFIMPTIFLVVGGPAVVQLMDVIGHR